MVEGGSRSRSSLIVTLRRDRIGPQGQATSRFSLELVISLENVVNSQNQPSPSRLRAWTGGDSRRPGS